MCLTRVTKVFRSPSRKVRYGFKVMEDQEGGKLRFPFYTLNHSLNVPLNRWIKAKEALVDCGGWGPDTTYTSGFHLFKSKKSVLRYKAVAGRRVVRVRYRAVTVQGYQDGLPCIVAQEIFVPKPGSAK